MDRADAIELVGGAILAFTPDPRLSESLACDICATLRHEHVEPPACTDHLDGVMAAMRTWYATLTGFLSSHRDDCPACVTARRVIAH